MMCAGRSDWASRYKTEDGCKVAEATPVSSLILIFGGTGGASASAPRPRALESEGASTFAHRGHIAPTSNALSSSGRGWSLRLRPLVGRPRPAAPLPIPMSARATLSSSLVAAIASRRLKESQNCWQKAARSYREKCGDEY
eukprot:scaffold85080_cov31-Tisochrysis_lutea.AAC.7